MKKVIFMLMAFIASTAISASAQRAGEYNLTASEDWNHSGIFAEIGAGLTAGDLDNDLSLSVGLGYRYHFGNGLYWDILKIAYYVPEVTNGFAESSTLRFLTGIRYNSAPIVAGHPLYGSFSAGYQLNVDDPDRWKGFAYEFGVGVVLNPTLSLGLMWEGNVAYVPRYSDGNFGTIGVKLGLQF